MITDYNVRKNEVLQILKKLEINMTNINEYFESINQPSPVKRINNFLDLIIEKENNIKSNRFKIIVAGEAKSGKSTFINAYLGLELLPMDVKQCTSSIVEVKYGQQFKIIATYADEREETISGDIACKEFLLSNAALDDCYRDIPVPTINEEILVKAGKRAKKKHKKIIINNNEIEDLLSSSEVIEANIHNLPIEEYRSKIKDYINIKKSHWFNIVTKIEVFFPLPENLEGIEIIDSPGVCARGGVSELTEKYIKYADAIVFLKPISGQALESTQFNQFLKNMSVERNHKALFLVLTRASNVNENELNRLMDEAYRQFNMLDKENILVVDSKAELYVKNLSTFASLDEIKSELIKLNNKKSLDDFVTAAYVKTAGDFGDGDKSDFLNALKEKSKFSDVYFALDRFGRYAHYLLLHDTLKLIYDLYIKLTNILREQIDLYSQKNEDPDELAYKIAITKAEIEELHERMGIGIEEAVKPYLGDSGYIRLTADKMVKNFTEEINQIDPNNDEAIHLLENKSMKQIDMYNKVCMEIQSDLVNKFDETILQLNDKSSLLFSTIKPELLEFDFDDIIQSKKIEANEIEKYEEGVTFTEIKERSVYSRKKHFNLVKKSITDRLHEIENDLINITTKFIKNVKVAYIDELASNINSKRSELDAISQAKNDAEFINNIIDKLKDTVKTLESDGNKAEILKGGLHKCIMK